LDYTENFAAEKFISMIILSYNLRKTIKMKTVSEFVQEAIDFTDRGLFEAALKPTCAAFELTARKVSSDVNYKKIVDENWWLISFVGFPHLTLPYLELPIVIKEISLNPRNHGLKEIVTFVLVHTLRNREMPASIGLNSEGKFNKQDGKLLIPNNLVFGLLGYVIFNPVNKDEVISDKYWFNVSSFKMFVAEFFGRIDLAERIVKFYQNKHLW